ncbi:protein Bouncer-like [Pseudorasbora parva]|uniref:protein Bouncer-like n=1 Tax=Pseudorasbora parva TaxID=51549 RepID=UPI00351E639C
MNTHIRSGVLQTLLCACALCLAGVCVLSAGPEVLLCYYCPLQARGRRCTNMTSECGPRELCFTGWRRYGPVAVRAAQGCASPGQCGSNRTVTLKGSRCEIHYTCCSGDLCNADLTSKTA